ncbi:hypothetical protein CUJ84_pRLN3000283 (plasmid) [Rhizobium leguminosarum]|uniref:Uncharacterized protein n=1 Tax=Rhizobium leguminosarum TaxID=384 RepID=A0A2K9ZGR4_RHILE|nr:hypothetical protein CUJ84_pRLN3000283 [Rhizobium leguminosarum]
MARCPVNYSAGGKPDPSGPQASRQQLRSPTDKPWDKVMLDDLDPLRIALVLIDAFTTGNAHQ